MIEVSIPQQAIDDDRLARQALNRLAQQEAEREAQEQAEAQQRRQEFQRQQEAAQAEQDRRVIEQLKTLRPLYVKRQADAEAGKVPTFWQAEQEILNALAAIDWADPPGLDERNRMKRRQWLRQQAQLLPRHNQIGLAPATTEGERVMQTVLTAITWGLIGPGYLHAGTQTAKFDVEQGA